MARRLALGAEVLGGLHQAGAEELLPESVDRDPRGQGVARVGQPLREAKAVLWRPVGQGRQEARRRAIDLVRLAVVLAALQEVRRPHLGTFLEDQRRRAGLL